MNDRLNSPDGQTFARRIELLRGAMAREALAAVLVPSSDPHISEYLPEHWQAAVAVRIHRLGGNAGRDR